MGKMIIFRIGLNGLGHKWTKQTKVDRYGKKGPKWTEIDGKVSRWTEMEQVDQIGPKRTEIGRI